MPFRHSYLQTQHWRSRMYQMDASIRWGTEVPHTAMSLHSVTDQDGTNSDLDRGTVTIQETQRTDMACSAKHSDARRRCNHRNNQVQGP